MNDDDYEDNERQIVEWKEAGNILADTGATALTFMGKLSEYAREKTITKREIERYRANRDIAIKEITEKYKFAHAYLKKTFEERRRIIEKDFEIIDKGLATKDYTLINQGLEHITTVVKDNPFKLPQITTPMQRRNMLEDGELSLR